MKVLSFGLQPSVINENGIDLSRLNSRVSHRFTGIFALTDNLIISTHLYDKLRKLTPADMGPVPFTDSFCQFTIRDGGYAIADSNVDDRLNGNANKGVVVAYHGVPVMLDREQLFGTLCHFDYVPHNLTGEEFSILSQCAAEVGAYLRNRGSLPGGVPIRDVYRGFAPGREG